MLATPIELLNAFPRLKALVVGDVMLDSYLTGSSRRLCPEAPVPIVDVRERLDLPGGAANCAWNLARLGAETEILGAVGTDCEGQKLCGLLANEGIRVSRVAAVEGRATLVKTRIAADEQVIVRYDQGNTAPLDKAGEERLCQAIRNAFPQVDLVIISDYGYGVLTPAVIDCLSELQRQHAKIIVVDSKRLRAYRALRPTLCKPNYREALSLLEASGNAPANQRWEALQSCGPELLAATGAHLVALTLDREGALVFEDGQWPYRTYATPVHSRNTAGAGDTYLCAFGLALSAGAETEVAAEIAAAAAAIVVEKPHTACCSIAELGAQLTGESTERTDLATLQAVTREYRDSGKRIVFTNGCFDILHRGHIAYLEQAKRLGDVLIVGVNTDESIQRLKGPTRPINTLADRVRVLAALSSVDHVITFEEDTPHHLIEAIRPDIFVKGGDYTRAKLPEAELVERFGGAVKILPFVADRSTTGIIHRICDAYGLTQALEDLRGTSAGSAPLSAVGSSAT